MAIEHTPLCTLRTYLSLHITLILCFSLISVGNTADYDGRIFATRELDLGTKKKMIINTFDVYII